MANTSFVAQEHLGICEQIDDRMQEIERLAEAGEWDKIEALLHRLPSLIARVPDHERRDILLATQGRVERIHHQATLQSEEIAAQLATLKTGRRATASYQATGDLALAP